MVSEERLVAGPPMKTDKRKALEASSDAELDAMLSNVLSKLLSAMQPLVYAAELYRDGVLVASAEITDASGRSTSDKEIH